MAKISGPELADSVIEAAIKAGATYVHFQPNSSSVAVRYRTNGDLQNGESMSKKAYESLATKLKSLGNLPATNHQLPQRGSFGCNYNDIPYTVTINTLPTVDGEKITLEISPNLRKHLLLEDLGYWSNSLLAAKEALSQKKGLVILSGPPNSGKTTSILSMLGILNDSGHNTISIEDPIKYRAGGISQIEVNPKLDLSFIKIMKTTAKQDIDTIALSQIANRSILAEAINLSFNHHLILAQYFSSDSIKTIGQMVQLGIEPAVVAHSLKLISSQRLVRRLCMDCRKSYKPDKETMDKINRLFNVDKPDNMRYLNQLEITYIKERPNLDVVTELSSSETKIKKLWRAKAGGCDKCNHSGYSIRTGLYELILISPAIEKLIVGRASSEVIRKQAIKEGTISLEVDGLVKSLRGLTSIDEIIKAI